MCSCNDHEGEITEAKWLQTPLRFALPVNRLKCQQTDLNASVCLPQLLGVAFVAFLGSAERSMKLSKINNIYQIARTLQHIQ